MGSHPQRGPWKNGYLRDYVSVLGGVDFSGIGMSTGVVVVGVAPVASSVKVGRTCGAATTTAP
jgi:hypothetical protein